MKNEQFFVGYREIFEKPKRNGYTINIGEAGVFTLDEAKAMTKFTCADGYGRWFIACEALMSFDGKKLNPTEIY